MMLVLEVKVIIVVRRDRLSVTLAVWMMMVVVVSMVLPMVAVAQVTSRLLVGAIVVILAM